MEDNYGAKRDIKQDDEEEEEEEEEEVVVLPGFRFHPTDEELVGFYLLRKVEGKSITIELITQADIYKYDPWDLPKLSSANTDEKEWYFFCKRGRKYRNSVRPNRVTLTGTGFWKATGIDKPIHSSKCDDNTKRVIGLKKSLVYYCGNAGKGTKTDWMMHEFRLPPSHHDSSPNNQEAEVWTVCRIFKKNASNRKRATKFEHRTSLASADQNAGNYINSNLQEIKGHFYSIPEEISIIRSPMASSSSSIWTENADGFFRNGNWDELGSVIGFGCG